MFKLKVREVKKQVREGRVRKLTEQVLIIQGEKFEGTGK